MIPEISIGEFLLFTIIALVVIRPDDWPKVLRKIGYYYGQIHDFMLQARELSRRTYDDIVQEVDSTVGNSPINVYDNGVGAGSEPVGSDPISAGSDQGGTALEESAIENSPSNDTRVQVGQ